MLKLEKLTSRPGAILQFKKRTFIDRQFIKALAWSGLVHLIILSSFRVKMAQIAESAPLSPIAVSLEMQKESEDSAVAFADMTRDQAMQLINASDSMEYYSKEVQDELAMHPSYLLPSAPTRLISLNEEEYELKQEQMSRFETKAYPLKIKLSQNIRECRIIDDGSSLFSGKKIRDFLPHTSPSYSITYSIEIDGETGKIVKQKRTHELRDKSLQAFADRLLTVIRFWTAEERQYKGTLTLTFYCSGEEINQLIL